MATFKGTGFSDAVRITKLDTQAPEVRFEADLEGAGTVGATAATTADGFFLIQVVTTAGTTVAAKVPFFNV